VTNHINGKLFGRLLVVKTEGRYVDCLCTCGTSKRFLKSNIMNGYTQSCGCHRNERVKEACGSHGMSRTPLYEKWKAMNRRCYNPGTDSYPWYGGKGIKLYDRWLSFSNFYADMAPSYQEGLTIDRLDNSKDYSPENCKWATHSENSRNNHV